MITLQRTSGFVLIITMMLIAVFSMLVLTSLQRLIYISRLNEQVSTEHQAFYALEAVALNLQTHVHDCVVSEQEISTITLANLSRDGCVIEISGIKYYYLTADLGVFPCLMLSTENGPRSSHHWWILLSSQRLNNRGLWLRIAVPEVQSVCPLKAAQIMVSNLLSWHIQRPKIPHFQ